MTSWQTCRNRHAAPWEAHTDCCDAPYADQLRRQGGALNPFEQADRELRRTWPRTGWALTPTRLGGVLVCECGYAIAAHHSGHLAFAAHLTDHHATNGAAS
ncbi:hypothetical protein [Pseudonocardia sp.]|uniref:hypothetical protein n=1 Tax=Pseudonocardia sp. TaxID=60912 RepID=UPI003D126787